MLLRGTIGSWLGGTQMSPIMMATCCPRRPACQAPLSRPAPIPPSTRRTIHRSLACRARRRRPSRRYRNPTHPTRPRSLSTPSRSLVLTSRSRRRHPRGRVRCCRSDNSSSRTGATIRTTDRAMLGPTRGKARETGRQRVRGVSSPRLPRARAPAQTRLGGRSLGPHSNASSEHSRSSRAPDDNRLLHPSVPPPC